MNKAILILTLPLLLAACDKKTERPARPKRPALTIVARSEAVDSGNVYGGKVHRRYETVLGFRILAKIPERT